MQLEPIIRHRKFHFPTAALIVLLTTAIMACAGPAAAPVEVTRIVEQPGPEVTREVQVTRVVPAPVVEQDPGELVIYSGRSESLVDPIIQQFKGTTGIDVQVKYAGTGALAATLLEEGDNSPADLFYAQDPGGLAAVSEQYFAGSTFEYPLVDGVRPSVLLTPLEDINQPEITLPDLSDLAGTQALLQKVGALP